VNLVVGRAVDTGDGEDPTVPDDGTEQAPQDDGGALDPDAQDGPNGPGQDEGFTPGDGDNG
jgi:hypothetical protein